MTMFTSLDHQERDSAPGSDLADTDQQLRDALKPTILSSTELFLEKPGLAHVIATQCGDRKIKNRQPGIANLARNSISPDTLDKL